MKTSFIATLTIVAFSFFCTQANADLFSLSGPMDPLQAGTNGGFGAFDTTITGAGNGVGTIFGSYDDATNLLNYSVSWSNLSADVTNMHFHLGAPGVSGGVDLGIPGPWTSPETATGVTLSAAQEANLLGGNWYVNVHTQNFGGGEIRGQVIVTPVPEPGAAALGLFAMAGLYLRRRR